MKYVILICIVFTTFSCQEETEITCRDTMICEGDCLFEIYNLSGKMRYASCFDKWGIVCEPTNFDEEVLVLFEDVEESYKVEGMPVVFSATIFENTFPLILPDPEPMPRLLKGELCDLDSKS